MFLKSMQTILSIQSINVDRIILLSKLNYKSSDTYRSVTQPILGIECIDQ